MKNTLRKLGLKLKLNYLNTMNTQGFNLRGFRNHIINYTYSIELILMIRP